MQVKKQQLERDVEQWTGSKLAKEYHKAVYLTDMQSSVQFSHSVVSDCCDPMNRSTPGLPVHHQLPEFTQTHMQNTSCKMQGWMKHKLESRLPKEISITSNMQMTPPLWQKEMSLLMKVM